MTNSSRLGIVISWSDGAQLTGATWVEARNIRAAIKATHQLLREIPNPSIVDDVLALSDAPWTPGASRRVGRVFISAPSSGNGGMAVLEWPGRRGFGTLGTRHADWPFSLRNALGYLANRPSPPLAALLDRDRSERPIPFMLYGMVARLMVVPPRLR